MPSLYDPISPRPGKTSRISLVVRPLLVALAIFCLSFLLLSSPVAFSQLAYSWAKPPPAPHPSLPAANAPAEIIPAAPTISIPKLSLQAPVIYEPSTAEASIQRALQDGVVHYGNTAVPGTPGNVAIFGHSSNDWWEPGNYKFVFVLLDKLTAGDRITVDYVSKRYIYEVTGSQVVEPTAVGVLNPTATPTLTLITCSPPGTSLRRLVVTAKQISPDPATVALANTAPAGPTPSNQPVTTISEKSGFTSSIWNVVASGLGWFFPSSPAQR